MRETLVDLAVTNVADGVAVDWDTLNHAVVNDEDRELLKSLHILSAVGNLRPPLPVVPHADDPDIDGMPAPGSDGAVVWIRRHSNQVVCEDDIEGVQHGDQAALDRLQSKLIPPLRRWAYRHLPYADRGTLGRTDLVKETINAVVERMDSVDMRELGKLQTYLQHAVLNRIHDAIRRNVRQPDPAPIARQLAASLSLEQAIGPENAACYERALERLPDPDHEAIVSRLELQRLYDDLAASLNQTREEARSTVTRGIKRLAEEMRRA